MVPVLIAVAAIAAMYYFSQQETADAPEHCDAETQEGNGMKLSYNELLQLAQDAGFDSDAGTAAAIALAESGGDTEAYNPETAAVGHHGRTDANDGKGSYGLWQIYLFMHPELEGQDLTDPQNNANAAYAIYSKAGGFSPWSTYGSGVYEKFVQA